MEILNNFVEILFTYKYAIFIFIICYALYLLYQKIMPYFDPIYEKGIIFVYIGLVYYGERGHKWYETLPEQPIYCNICSRIVLPYRESI